jgi:hypothetical protein
VDFALQVLLLGGVGCPRLFGIGGCRCLVELEHAGRDVPTIVGSQYPPLHGEDSVDDLLLLPGHGENRSLDRPVEIVYVGDRGVNRVVRRCSNASADAELTRKNGIPAQYWATIV